MYIEHVLNFSVSRFRPLERRAIWRIVGLFVLFGVIWVAASDKLLGALVADRVTRADLRLVEGWVFVLVGGALLYWILQRESRRTVYAQATLDRLGRERQAVFESALDPMLLVNDAAVISDANLAAVEILAGPEGTISGLIGLSLADCLSFDDQRFAAERRLGDAVLQRPGFEPRLVQFSITPAITEDHHLIVLQDVTAERRHEREWRQRQTLDAIGRLAAGVAHDFNNLLTVIFGQADFAVAGTDVSEETRLALEEIRRSAERGVTLTRELTAFARDEQIELQPIDLNRLVEDLEVSLRSLLGGDHELVLELAPRLGFARADARQLERVVLNLVTNARDASEQGQSVVVRTGDAADREGFVCVEVVDRGVGMDEVLRARIFEPLFTTKKAEEGTGLGLAMAHKLVTRLGGRIQVESALGEGSTFRVLLPSARLSTRSR